VVPVPVPALVPVVLLAPLVCDSTNRTENTSHIYTGPSKIYVGHQPRTTVEIPFKIKDLWCGALLVLGLGHLGLLEQTELQEALKL